MKVRTLAIALGDTRVGILFQYGEYTDAPVIRFVADEAFAQQVAAPTLSLSMLAADPESQRALWANITAPLFNGRPSPRNGYLLPAFFQGLLPEGIFRDHVAAARSCDPKDHFEMLAACGKDLPGNVYASPVDLDRDALAHLITQDADSLEISVTADPMEDGVSVSGVQPKLALIKDGERYVGRTKVRHGSDPVDTHIIAKLPVVGYPLLPELEHLSLQLAAAAGVDACEAILEPLSKLAVDHGYDLGETDQQTQFLAVTRFDRSPAGRIHVEDFGQVLAVEPEDKYSRSYLEVAAVLMATPSLGEPAVHELLRRMTVNEMLQNPDMHLKNIGLIYPDGITPQLSKAYDIVAYGAYAKRTGHALHILPPVISAKPRVRVTPPDASKEAKPSLTPSVLREFCSRLNLLEKPAAAVVRETVNLAVRFWPAMITASSLTGRQKAMLLAQFDEHPFVVSARKRLKLAS